MDPGARFAHAAIKELPRLVDRAMNQTKLGITREEFLASIRRSLSPATGSALRDPLPAPSNEILRITRHEEDLPAVFTRHAIAMGMKVHRSTVDSLGTTIQSLLTSLDAKRIVLDIPAYPIANLIRNAISDGRKIIDPAKARNLDVQFDCDVGITSVFAAIAETGTLVIASDMHRSRGTFLIPPVHIAVIFESHILPDMIDLWPVTLRGVHPALTLVTGPSKTADIEGILITGVHGPKAVHVIVLENPKD